MTSTGMGGHLSPTCMEGNGYVGLVAAPLTRSLVPGGPGGETSGFAFL